MDNVLVSKEVLQKVIDYLWYDEEKDYAACLDADWTEEDTEQHIYSSLKQLQDCINDQE